jgi:hypothetical protein
MPNSTQFWDTDPRAIEVLLSLERNLTPARKTALVFEMSELVLSLAAAGVRQAHPGAGERELLARLAGRCLDRDLVIRAYGWDPDTDVATGTSL